MTLTRDEALQKIERLTELLELSDDDLHYRTYEEMSGLMESLKIWIEGLSSEVACAPKTITRLKQTCYGCPSQWDGETSEGNRIYIRYRWGTLRVDLNGEPIFSLDHGDSTDGVLDTHEMQQLTRSFLDWSEVKYQVDDTDW